MAKKLDVKEVSQTVDIAPVTLDNFALGIVKKDGKSTVVKIAYNIETGDVGKIEVVQDNCVKEQGEDVFKVRAALDIFTKG